MRERIKEIMEREGMGQSQFADYIGVNRPTLSHILAGRNNPSMEVVMKIHQKFQKISLLWLLDGIGTYEHDVVADYSGGVLNEETGAAMDEMVSYERTGQAQSSSSAMASEQTQARFYQGELFAENPVFAPESTGVAKNRKEMPLQTPQKAPYLSDTQIEYARKSLQRKIVEIKIFFDDGTYETFKP